MTWPEGSRSLLFQIHDFLIRTANQLLHHSPLGVTSTLVDHTDDGLSAVQSSLADDQFTLHFLEGLSALLHAIHDLRALGVAGEHDRCVTKRSARSRRRSGAGALKYSLRCSGGRLRR
jgi:hypothetical protein